MTFGYSVRVDFHTLRSQTQIPIGAIVGAYLLVDCRSSQIRLIETCIVDAELDEPVEVWISIPPGTVADAISLHRGLVLMESDSSADDRSPSKPGARILEDDPVPVSLEGDWGRFPLQAIDFNATRWEASAAWALDIRYEDTSDPFQATVRISVNSSHPAGAAALVAVETPWTKQCVSALSTDIVRQLYSKLATDERFLESANVDVDESLGHVASEMARNWLDLSLREVILFIREDPVAFDTLVQDRIGYLTVDANAVSSDLTR
jgi:hypothetical protein